ncbi:MAG TPA: hypothetical protein VJI74_02700 [Candidatus Paceibacterota bacterium]
MNYQEALQLARKTGTTEFEEFKVKWQRWGRVAYISASALMLGALVWSTWFSESAAITAETKKPAAVQAPVSRSVPGQVAPVVHTVMAPVTELSDTVPGRGGFCIDGWAKNPNEENQYEVYHDGKLYTGGAYPDSKEMRFRSKLDHPIILEYQYRKPCERLAGR